MQPVLLAMLAQLILLLQQPVSTCAKFSLIEAGKDSRRGHMLNPGEKICPTKFSGGFSIMCVPKVKKVATVAFLVNGRLLRVETRFPFFINGDKNGNVLPWTNYPKSANITCAYNGGRDNIHVSFICGIEKSPKRMGKSPVLKPGRNPKNQNPTTLPKRTTPIPMKPTVPKSVTSPMFPRANCVIIDVKRNNGLSSGWVAVGNAVSYKPNSNFIGAAPGPAAPLFFYFKVPKQSAYAVTIDMEAPHGTEHNDVWLKFPYGKGLNLRRFGNVVNGGTGYIKAYHNRAKRATEAFSIDFNPHTFSTANVLKPGVTYKIIMSGRSTKVKVYKIVMFPCKGLQCLANSPHWKRYVQNCK